MFSVSHLVLVVLLLGAPTAARGANFYSTNDEVILGAPNLTAALGNPLKGLMGGSIWKNPADWPDQPVTSLEWFNIPFDDVFVAQNTTDWTKLETLLSGCANRNRHAVFSVSCCGRSGADSHFPDAYLYSSSSIGRVNRYGYQSFS